MIRTSTVQLTMISAVAYRQKLVSGGAGITIWGYNVRQPGLASISKTSGEAIPTANTPLEYYPPEAFAEAIKLTAGLPYKNLGKVQLPEGLAVEPEEAEEAPAQPEIEAVIDSAEYQRVVDAYSDKDGRLSYTLLNKVLIQTAKASGQVRLMIEDHASLEEIRLQVVKAKLRSVSRNPALTDEQVQLMIELLDEISPKGVLRPLNEEIRKWLRDGKMK